MKNINDVITGFFILILVGFVFTGCPDTPDDDVIIADDEYVDDTDIQKKHVVGTTPCPQNLTNLTIHQSGNKFGLEAIDSAEFSCSHNAIDVYVNDDKGASYCTFENTTENKLTVEFNCGQTTSVNTEVTCDFYKNDTLKKTETINVNLSVN